MKDFQAGAADLYRRIQEGFRAAGVAMPGSAPDHLCYRVATLEEYESTKREIREHGELLTEAPVRGRPIATYRLRTPLRFGEHDVADLEVPAPKTGSAYPTGFEHAEYVVDEPLELFRDRHPSLRGELRANGFNPELVVDFGNAQVKFHRSSLADVIALEGKEPWQRQIVVFDLDGSS